MAHFPPPPSTITICLRVVLQAQGNLKGTVRISVEAGICRRQLDRQVEEGRLNRPPWLMLSSTDHPLLKHGVNQELLISHIHHLEGGIRESLLFAVHPAQGYKLWNDMCVQSSKGEAGGRQGRGVYTLRMPRVLEWKRGWLNIWKHSIVIQRGRGVFIFIQGLDRDGYREAAHKVFLNRSTLISMPNSDGGPRDHEFVWRIRLRACVSSLRPSFLSFPPDHVDTQ